MAGSDANELENGRIRRQGLELSGELETLPIWIHDTEILLSTFESVPHKTWVCCCCLSTETSMGIAIEKDWVVTEKDLRARPTSSDKSDHSRET